jgi:rhodanese-related sulfurtransferase
MKKFFVVLTTAIALLTGVAHGKEIRVSAENVDKLIADNAQNPDFVIIDIRTPEEYYEDHLENAININFYAKDFKANLAKLDKNKSYAVYCRSGGRSSKAMPVFNSLGFKTVYHLVDGFQQM